MSETDQYRIITETLVVFVFAITGLALIVRFWPSPMIPVFWGLIGVAGFGAYWLFLRDFETNEIEFDASLKHKIELLPIGLMVLATVFFAGWISSGYRAQMLSVFALQSSNVMNQALEDPDSGVRATACANIVATQSDELSFETLPNRMYTEPSVAIQCLKLAQTYVEQSQKDSFTEPQIVFAMQLTDKWWQQLMSRAPGKKACDAAGAMLYSQRFADAPGQHRAFTCSVAAPTQQARRCCQQQVKSNKRKMYQNVYEKVLKNPGDYPEDMAVKYFGPLAASAFDIPLSGQIAPKIYQPSAAEPENPDKNAGDSSDSGKENEDASKPRKAKISLDVDLPNSISKQTFQDWVVTIGCNLASRADYEGKATTDLIRAFAPVLNSAKTCKKGDVSRDQFFNSSAWATLCRGMYSYNRTVKAEAPNNAVCSSLVLASVRDAAEEGKIKIQKALSKAKHDAVGPDHNISEDKLRTSGAGVVGVAGGPGGFDNISPAVQRGFESIMSFSR